MLYRLRVWWIVLRMDFESVKLGFAGKKLSTKEKLPWLLISRPTANILHSGFYSFMTHFDTEKKFSNLKSCKCCPIKLFIRKGTFDASLKYVVLISKIVFYQFGSNRKTKKESTQTQGSHIFHTLANNNKSSDRAFLGWKKWQKAKKV